MVRYDKFLTHPIVFLKYFTYICLIYNIKYVIMGKYREVTNELLQLVQEGKTGKEISRILKLDYSTVHAKLRKLNINLPNKHNELKFDNTVFDKINTEEKAYWLGFLYADGYVSPTVNTVELTLKGEDIEHLEKYKKFVKGIRNINISNVKLNEKTFSRCRFATTDKHFKERLIELGCIPNKTLTLKFPNKEIFENENLLYDFIRGYIDGDGCLTYTSTGRLAIQIIGTKEFLSGIQELFPQFKKYAKDKRRTSNTYSLNCSCNSAEEVANKLYKNATIYLQRKYDRYCRAIQK